MSNLTMDQIETKEGIGLAGIHIHSHDVLDEGAENVIAHIRNMKHIDVVYPEVNAIFERNPNPTGVLPHNPVHSHVFGNGLFQLQLEMAKLSPKLYQPIDKVTLLDRDYLKEFKEAVGMGSDIRIVPKINLLNGEFAGETLLNRVVNYRGEPVQHWICPNGPHVLEMWSKTIAAITETYGLNTHMIDHIRYPDWTGTDGQFQPDQLFSCFCPQCVKIMSDKGMKSDQVIAQMAEIELLLLDKKYDTVVSLLLESPLLQQWIRFRQDQVSRFIERLISEVKQINPTIELWLDLWPPAYAWMLGQDYSRLTKVSQMLKHFPYHKLGGGADVQSLIRGFADTTAEREQAFTAFKRLFALPYNQTYSDFVANGFPISFVREQNQAARLLSHPNTVIHSGVQIWNISSDDVIEATREAKLSVADDWIYYCYGWAELDCLRELGKKIEAQPRKG